MASLGRRAAGIVQATRGNPIPGNSKENGPGHDPTSRQTARHHSVYDDTDRPFVAAQSPLATVLTTILYPHYVCAHTKTHRRLYKPKENKPASLHVATGREKNEKTSTLDRCLQSYWNRRGIKYKNCPFSLRFLWFWGSRDILLFSGAVKTCGQRRRGSSGSSPCLHGVYVCLCACVCLGWGGDAW